MQKYLLITTFLFLSLLSSAKKHHAPSFEGKVFDKVSNMPIFGAKVFIKELNKSFYTDFDGNFSLKNVKEGTYHVVISFLSYQDVSRELTIGTNHHTAFFKLKSN